MAAEKKPVAAKLVVSEAEGLEFFESKVRPIFVQHCTSCHGEKEQEAGLRLDIKAGLEKGGESGPVLNIKNPKESLLLKMVRRGDGRVAKMPPDYALNQDLVDTLQKWIEMGAPDPRDGVVKKAEQKFYDWYEAAQYWAFRPLEVAELPTVKDPNAKQPIDRFIAASLEKAGLTPLAKADKRTLIRRATYDLTGLPATYAEVQAFEKDASPDAFAKVIDRLLASPHYGEHQARRWLDIARYAEDKLTGGDDEKSRQGVAWRYRDWVAGAFNRDLPYDQFVKLQIAADFMLEFGEDRKELAALGLIGLGPNLSNLADMQKGRADEWDDRIDVITRGFMGLTVSCARCHDHKFDPIPTQDYYALVGVISSTKTQLLTVSPQAEIDAYDAAQKVLDAAEEEVKWFVQAQADKLASIKADQIPALVAASWKFEAQKLNKPDLKEDDFAKSLGLEPNDFKAIKRYIGRKDLGKNHYLAKWFEIQPKQGGSTEPGPEVAEVAKLLQDKLKSSLSRPFPKKGEKYEPKIHRDLDLQNEFFGSVSKPGGMFGISEEKVMKSVDDQWKKKLQGLKETAAKAKAKMPSALAKVCGVEDDKVADLRVYLRGSHSKPGPAAPRRFLRVLSSPDTPMFTNGSGRMELAEAIVAPTNPLTPRVFVNRVWQQHFGKGIVLTMSNFGKMGTPPSHPELLDYLADRFVKQGWSVKKLHREIMLSDAYQRASSSKGSSTLDMKNQAVDSENKWLWRANRRRLAVEPFRDSVLASAGTLDAKIGGPSEKLDSPTNVRRTIYGKVSRDNLDYLLKLFDYPDPNITSDQRVDTMLPQQQLFLMNSPFIVDNSRALAGRISMLPTPAEQALKAFEMTLGRNPSEKELALSTAYLSAQDDPEQGTLDKKLVDEKKKVDADNARKQAEQAKKAEEDKKAGKQPEAKPMDKMNEPEPMIDRPANLTRLERFVQALLVSNEFMYID